MIALKPTLIYSEPVDISCVLSVLKEGMDALKEYNGIKISPQRLTCNLGLWGKEKSDTHKSFVFHYHHLCNMVEYNLE